MAGLDRGRRLLIIVAYTLVFWGALPLALLALGHGLDVALRLDLAPVAWGWALVAAGLAFLAWAALSLRIRGHGLPVSALPPANLVVSGPYAAVRHPMYVGYHLALIGLALALGSWGLLIVGGPLFLTAWVAYALVEERALRRRFGAEYRAYQRDVALWPRVPFYRIIQALVAARVLPVTVEGRDHLPRGPFVVVANHACYMDPVFLSRLTWRRIRFLSTAEAFRSGPLGWALRRSGAIPLRRYRVDPVACRIALRRLTYGEITGHFVEGERSALGAYEGAMPRAAGIIARLGVPVIPVGIIGNYDAGPRWAGALRRRPVTLRVGPPVAFVSGDPARDIDTALATLLAGAEPRVHLAGLRIERLSRILWACPRCQDEAAWRPADLRCDACGARYTNTADGLLADEKGAAQTLAALGAPLLRAASTVAEVACHARGAYERSPFGPIRPLEPLGVGTLRLTREALTFTPDAPEAFAPLTIPLPAVRSATTERADTLQVATATGTWQFRPDTESVFRLHRIALDWARPRLERLSSGVAGTYPD